MIKKKTKRPKEFKEVVAQLKKLKGMPKNRDGIYTTIRTEVDPQEIKDKVNKKNWKLHPRRQLDYVGGSIKEHGWATIPIYCANTDRLIDGHGRLSISLQKEYKFMPIDVGWWTEDEGDTLLLSLDTSGNMSSVDGNALMSLTEASLKRALKGEQTDKPKIGLLSDVHSFAKSIAEKKRDKIAIRPSKKSPKKIIGDNTRVKKDDRESIADHDHLYYKELREDITFPSTGNELGLPDLIRSKLYTAQDYLPVDTFDRSGSSLLSRNYYCEGSRPFDSRNHLKPAGGFLGFFTEDETFEKYYREPARYVERLVDEQWNAVVEPDFSTYWDWPFAKRLWSVYKSRWVARYWQELGINIIPIIRRSNDLERDKWMYDSLPETPVGFMQIRMGGKKNSANPSYWAGIGAVLHYVQQNRGLQFVLFYGPSTLEKYILGKIPEGMKYRMVTPFINKRRPPKSEYPDGTKE
jgi:hypothetical protein